MSDNLQEIVERVKAGSRSEADIQAIAAAIRDGKIVLVNAPRAVGVSGDVTDSQVVPGNKNVTGDHNIVIYGADTQTIQAVLSQYSGSSKSEKTTSSEKWQQSIVSIIYSKIYFVWRYLTGYLKNLNPIYRDNVTANVLVQQARLRCGEKIQDLYSKIRLLNFRYVEVDQLYVEVHILDRPVSRVYATIPDLPQGRDLRNDFDRFGLRDGKRLLGLEVANRFSRVMVLGKPGAGKSTFLRYLAIACCKGEFLPDHIPVLIELRSIQDANQFILLDTIQQELRFTDQQTTKKILDTGKVWLLLDGLDEVADKSRRTVQNQISEFIQKHHKTRIILTCRTQTVEYILPNFEYVEVADFNPEQVEIFAQNWFAALADTPEQGAVLTARFMNTLRLPEHQRTAELVVTPLLLSLTCWVFQDAGDLPAKRIELYQRGLDFLLEQWGIQSEALSEWWVVSGIEHWTLSRSRYF